MRPNRVLELFRERVLQTLGWRAPDAQHHFRIEDVCLAILALRNHAGPELDLALRTLLSAQVRGGSWPAFAGDDTPECWTTALAVLALTVVEGPPSSREAGFNRLLHMTGREANWFWRWKFLAIDKSVTFDPAKYGWSWVPGTMSWVIPTAFAILALRHAKTLGFARSPLADERITLGIEMLLDRMCPGGGWNAGNGVAFGVPYKPYIDATATALLAVRGEENGAGVQASLRWLAKVLPSCPSPYSLAWGILGLAAYRNRDAEGENALAAATDALLVSIEETPDPDVATVATCALALEAVDGANVFEV